MNVRYQKKELNQIVSDFYQVTGINLAILDCSFQSVTDHISRATEFCNLIHKREKNSCASSDAVILKRCAMSHQPEMHICHAGLIDIALPILYEDTIMGYIIMGQMRRNIPFSEIASLFSQEAKELEQAYEKLACYDDACAMSAARLAVMLASFILTKNMIEPDYDYTTEKILQYIHTNITKDLSIPHLCKALNLSKNALYAHMRDGVGCTVNEYVTAYRIRLAKDLLEHSTESVSGICEQVGFWNDTYFCRRFKQETGMTPLQYRKQSLSSHL